MWIASKHGWFSFVLKDGHFNIRARRKRDLATLLEHTVDLEGDYEIETWPAADYRFRIRIPEHSDDFACLFGVLCASVDYGNFKSMIGASTTQRDKISEYHEIWAIMHQYQRRHE
jgi:hypothetical protein